MFIVQGSATAWDDLFIGPVALDIISFDKPSRCINPRDRMSLHAW